MAVNSMTGFARAAGSGGGWRWAFEIKSVNAKGLDLRLRMPPPFDRVEAEARSRLGKALARGTCFATLTAQREGAAITLASGVSITAGSTIVLTGNAEFFGPGSFTGKGNFSWSGGTIDGSLDVAKTIHTTISGAAKKILMSPNSSTALLAFTFPCGVDFARRSRIRASAPALETEIGAGPGGSRRAT